MNPPISLRPLPDDLIVTLMAQNESAAWLAQRIEPAAKEQCEVLASTTKTTGSMIAGFDIILENKRECHWFYFAYYGFGCDANDRGWGVHGGCTPTLEKARDQIAKFKVWFNNLHAQSGGITEL
jgi:hypothetical protein